MFVHRANILFILSQKNWRATNHSRRSPFIYEACLCMWGEGFSRAWGNFCPLASPGASPISNASIVMTF